MKYPEHARRMKDAFNLTVFTGKIWDGHAVSHADGFDAPFCMIFFALKRGATGWGLLLLRNWG